MNSKSQSTQIGRNLLKSMVIKDRTRWVLYDHKKNQLGKGESPSFEDARHEAAKLISSIEIDTLAARKNGIPSAAEFAEALTAVITDPKSKYWDMLKAHCNAPDRMMTATGLADAAGYAHFSAANSHYGRLGHNIADFLNFTPPGRYKNGGILWITALVIEDFDYDPDENGHWRHQLRPELAAALKIIGISKV